MTRPFPDPRLARPMGELLPASRPGPEADHPLIKRLEEYADLGGPALAALRELVRRPARQIAPRQDLIRQGSKPERLYLINKGWASRYKILADGRLQIVDFLIPGDLCDLNIYILSRMDHSIAAITGLEVIEIGRGELEDICQEHAEIIRALWWQELVSKSCNREWIVNVGVRSAAERLSHLICELFLRLESIGLTDGYSCEFPLTQIDLANATGLTPVHVNRTLQEMRREGLLSLSRRVLTIPDMDALKARGLFNPDYLHLERLRRHPNAKGPVGV